MLITGFILILITGAMLFAVRKKIRSGYVFFAFMTLMALPSLLMMKETVRQWCGTYPVNPLNIVILAGLLCAGFLPWLSADIAFADFRQKIPFPLTDKKLKILKFSLLTLLVMSVSAMIYLFPYTLEGITTPTALRREYIRSNDVLPAGWSTTLSVGVASLSLYCIPAFYLTFIYKPLKNLRYPLVVASLCYAAAATVFAGREGVFVTVVFYAVCGMLILPKSKEITRKITKICLVIGIPLTVLFLVFTISRFHNGSRYGSFLTGTVGYVAQQPYVFNATVEDRKTFQGVDRCFPLIAAMEGREPQRPVIKERYEWMFGTMWAEFYSIRGWKSLIVCALIFVGYYTSAMWLLARRKQWFALLMLFVPYLYIESMGWFYFRPNQSVAVNLFWLVASVAPLLSLLERKGVEK